MDNIERKRKREDSLGESSVREIKPEPAVIDLADSDIGENTNLGNNTEARPLNNNQGSFDHPVDVKGSASSFDLESFTVLADRNHELIQSLMKVPEDLREEMAIKTSALKTDMTMTMVDFTKQMTETLDGTKRDLKECIDNYNPQLDMLEKKTNNLDAAVKELDKKVDKNLGANIKAEVKAEISAEVKGEVNECLRGFGAYITEYFSKNNTLIPDATGNTAASTIGNSNGNESRNSNGNENRRSNKNENRRSNRNENRRSNRNENIISNGNESRDLHRNENGNSSGNENRVPLAIPASALSRAGPSGVGDSRTPTISGRIGDGRAPHSFWR